MKIAIIYTTFMRPELVKLTLPSIVENTNEEVTILVGDQENNNEVSDICKSLNNNRIHCIRLSFDCGLSASRNLLIEKAKELNIPYCVVTADSIVFTEKYKFQLIVKFLESNEKYGTVGFDLKGRICWECDIDLIEGKHFSLDIPRKQSITYNDIKYQPVDLHRNFFIAKTEALIVNKWDDNLKLLEHEDHAWRWKQKKNNYQRFYTEVIEGKYINSKPYEYNKFRRRMYNEFMIKLRKKYNITGWVVYTEDLKRRFNSYKRGKL